MSRDIQNKGENRIKFLPNALATGIGSLPHKDPNDACRLICDFFPEIPFWPQLPKRAPLENMYMQYFIGYSSYCDEEPFDPSLFVDIRKRLGIEQVNKINEHILNLSNKSEGEEKNDFIDSFNKDDEKKVLC